LETQNQNALHEKMGGIVPFTAANAHTRILPELIRKVLDQSRLLHLSDLDQISGIAVTRGPGLAPCLGAGMTSARQLAILLRYCILWISYVGSVSIWRT
jgi:N6-L-threonylcarbamoyladenine synthase